MRVKFIVTLTLLVAVCSLGLAKQPDAAPPPMAKDYDPKSAKSPKKHSKPKKLPSSTQKTVRREGNRIIEEYRVRGRLTMVKVISKKAKPYFIYYDQDWNSSPSTRDLDDTPKKPTWKLFSW